MLDECLMNILQTHSPDDYRTLFCRQTQPEPAFCGLTTLVIVLNGEFSVVLFLNLLLLHVHVGVFISTTK